MTSLLTSVKQIPANAGYYVSVGDCKPTLFTNLGTNDSPSFTNTQFVSSVSTVVAVNGPSDLYTNLGSPGASVFRDHGLTLLSSSRVFRKVQLMVPGTGSVVNKGSDGIQQTGTNPVNYLTCFIELPGQGTGSGSATFTPVARLG
jgi:hypothetical protein